MTKNSKRLKKTIDELKKKIQIATLEIVLGSGVISVDG